MRARNLKPAFFLNVNLGSGDPLRQILFEGLWCVADRAGRLEDEPLKIKVQVLPYRDCDVNALLDSLVPEFILRYEKSGKRYVQIVNFEKHQYPHIKEAESTIPAPLKNHTRTVLKRPLPLTSSFNLSLLVGTDALRLAEILKERILVNDPKAKTNPEKWAKDIDKLIRIDKRDFLKWRR